MNAIPSKYQIPKVAFVRSKLHSKIDRAFRICHKHPESKDCQIAWIEVEELSKAVYREQMKDIPTIQDVWCDEQPGHEECREYDL